MDVRVGLYKESWSLKNWCFELWCWRRLLRVPWTVRRSNQSILKEINPQYSLEGLILMATWHKELTHLKRPWCWEGLKAGREGDDRAWDGWITSLTQWTWVWVNSGSWWRTGRPGMLQSMGSQSQTWLSDWTDNLISSKVYLNFILFYIVFLLIFLLVSTYLSYLSFKINSTVFISF